MTQTHAGPFAQCANDQKPVPVDGLGTALSEPDPKGGKVFFCSEACHTTWLATQHKEAPLPTQQISA